MQPGEREKERKEGKGGGVDTEFYDGMLLMTDAGFLLGFLFSSSFFISFCPLEGTRERERERGSFLSFPSPPNMCSFSL